jgi:hypothetical protein
MQEKKETYQFPQWQHIAAYPFVKGPVLGASVMTMVTPMLNYTNHYLDGKSMPWRNAMTGSKDYAVSAIPSYAMSFALYHFFKQFDTTSSIVYDSLCSFLAGAASGFVSNPFEAVAQNKQLAKLPSTTETMQKMVHHHGFSAPFKGGAVTAGREGCWSLIVLSAIREVSNHMVTMGMEKNKADLFATIVLAGLYGGVSTPVNQFRFRKQQGLTESTPQKSYLAHAKDIWNQDPQAPKSKRVGFFFKGWHLRVATTTIAAGLIYKGNEFYDDLVKSNKI